MLSQLQNCGCFLYGGGGLSSICCKVSFCNKDHFCILSLSLSLSLSLPPCPCFKTIMQKSQRCSSYVYLHDPLHCMIAGSDDKHEFEELDPSGRYGRYKDVLGKGAFKIVYKGFDIVDGIEVAWNQIKVQNALHSSEDIERFYSEVHLLKTLKHKNIIKFYHSWVDTEAMKLNFLTEIFTSGTLRQYRKRHKRIDIRAIKKWSRQILRGLLYLHSQDPPIIHRDLKCDNIFINGNQGEVKVGDLGLATILNQAHAAQAVIGTPEFMAPELYEEEYTELVDIYSFGMCLLEMVTGEYPYSECSSAAQIYKKVISGKKPAALSKVKNPHLRQFVEKCIATASSRLPARELLMDPFLREDEVCDMVGESCSIHKGAYGTRSLAGSLSNIQASFMDRGLPSVESFSSLGSSASLPDMCQEHMLYSPVNRDSHHGLLNKRALQNDWPILRHIEDKVGRKMDFQIKGKRRENDIIQLRLRIADTEDDVRVIHFPFNVGHDTAMSVAREMVTELDLFDQDVIKIAEIIDDAVVVMVPDLHMWVTANKASRGSKNQRLVDAINLEHNWSCEHLSMVSLNSPSIDPSQNALMSSPHEHPEAAPTPSQMEATTHGRFEEIAYHHNAATKSLPPSAGEDCVTCTNISSKELWDPLFSPSLAQSLNGKCSSKSSSFQDPLATCSRAEAGVLGQSADLGIGNGSRASQKEASHNKLSLPNTQQNPARASGNYDYNLVTWQLKDLAFQHEQELEDLQYKHKEAPLNVKIYSKEETF